MPRTAANLFAAAAGLRHTREASWWTNRRCAFGTSTQRRATTRLSSPGCQASRLTPPRPPPLPSTLRALFRRPPPRGPHPSAKDLQLHSVVAYARRYGLLGCAGCPLSAVESCCCILLAQALRPQTAFDGSTWPCCGTCRCCLARTVCTRHPPRAHAPADATPTFSTDILSILAKSQSLVDSLQVVAKTFISQQPAGAPFRVGFHAVPSMRQLHLHVISQVGIRPRYRHSPTDKWHSSQASCIEGGCTGVH